MAQGTVGKTYDFRESLKFGQMAEYEFMQGYYEPIIYSPKLTYDFRTVEGNDKIELKTDDWAMEKTKNFFWERFSDFHKETPGGPWRARLNRVDRFCYYFIRNGVYYEWTDVGLLCKTLQKHIDKQKSGPILIRNKAWYTAGYAFPRELVLDLATEYTIKKEEVK